MKTYNTFLYCELEFTLQYIYVNMKRNFIFITLLCTISVLTLTWCSSTYSQEWDSNINSEENVGLISEMYTEEEINEAKDIIAERISIWPYYVENLKIEYDWDDLSKDFLLYCQSKNPAIIESASFTTSFYVPEQEEPLPRNFEGERNIDSYVFFLGRTESWEWEIISDWLW